MYALLCLFIQAIFTSNETYLLRGKATNYTTFVLLVVRL